METKIGDISLLIYLGVWQSSVVNVGSISTYLAAFLPCVKNVPPFSVEFGCFPFFWSHCRTSGRQSLAYCDAEEWKIGINDGRVLELRLETSKT